MKVIVVLCAIYILGSESLIIPDDLPSILSVIYSNIPTIKKGTDSRLGWGFRLGDRADFQVLVELGPQTNTQPLANQGEGSSNNKRNALSNLADTLYAQRQQEKKEQKENKEIKKATGSVTPEGADWLQTWSKSVTKSNENDAPPLKPRPGLAIGEIDAKSVISDDTEDVAKEQRIKVFQNTRIQASTQMPEVQHKSTTSKEDALDNVDLD